MQMQARNRETAREELEFSQLLLFLPFSD